MKVPNLVVSLALFVVGLGAFLWASPKMDRLNSLLGQFASSFASDQDTAQFTLWKIAYYGGIVTMLVAVVVAVVAFLKKF